MKVSFPIINITKRFQSPQQNEHIKSPIAFNQDIFIKSNPAFGSGDTKENLKRWQQYTIQPLLEDNDARKTYDTAVKKYYNLEPELQHISFLEDGLKSIIKNPRKVKGYKIFNTVDSRLEQFKQFHDNINEWNYLKNKASRFNVDIPEKDNIFVIPEELNYLTPLFRKNKEINLNLKNGLQKVDISANTQFDKLDDVYYHLKTVIDTLNFDDAADLNLQINNMDNLSEAELKNLERSAKYFLENHQFYMRHKDLCHKIAESAEIPDDLSIINSNAGKVCKRYMKTISHNANHLKNFYDKNYSKPLKENRVKLDEKLKEQKQTIENFYLNIENAKRLYFNQLQNKHETYNTNTHYDDDLPF